MARFRVELELSAEEEDSGAIVEEVTEATSGGRESPEAAFDCDPAEFRGLTPPAPNASFIAA